MSEDDGYDPIDKLGIEFKAIHDQYDEIFNGKSLADYTIKELADFMDDWIQITDSQIGVIRIIWENMKNLKRLVDSTDSLDKFVDEMKKPKEEDDYNDRNLRLFC